MLFLLYLSKHFSVHMLGRYSPNVKKKSFCTLIHCLICFCNKHTFFKKKEWWSQDSKKHNKTDLMMSFTCLRCTIVSPTTDKIKDQLLGRVYKACCDLWSPWSCHRTQVLKHVRSFFGSECSLQLEDLPSPAFSMKALSSSKPKSNDCFLEPPQEPLSEGIALLSRGHRIVFIFLF